MFKSQRLISESRSQRLTFKLSTKSI
uniref:Uncharacterized protein n=1 Tax=Romanomermis culicivorax TaxID=13658 RepID=A0A915I0A9_ROMCU